MAPKEKKIQVGKEHLRKTKKVQTKLKENIEKSDNVVRWLRIKCPICFEHIRKEEAVTTLCGHVFCKMCLQKALRQNSFCPKCRNRVKGIRFGHHALCLDANVCDEIVQS